MEQIETQGDGIIPVIFIPRLMDALIKLFNNFLQVTTLKTELEQYGNFYQHLYILDSNSL
mgnify:CR=1|jgi:hypothetical protein|tara:strand:- start:207 stop:386 length:180 start_codon:yes stop_codon:yes gene_type:complete